MQYQFFTIPAEDGAHEAEQMNRFLRGARVVKVKKRFLKKGVPRWTFAVE